MVSRREFLVSLASITASGVLAQAMTPLAAARPLVAEDEELAEEPDEDELEDQDEPEDTDDESEDEPEDTDDESEDESEDTDDDESEDEEDGSDGPPAVTTPPVLTGEHDNGLHLGLVKPHKNEKLRGSGFWAQQSVSGKAGRKAK